MERSRLSRNRLHLILIYIHQMCSFICFLWRARKLPRSTRPHWHNYNPSWLMESKQESPSRSFHKGSMIYTSPRSSPTDRKPSPPQKLSQPPTMDPTKPRRLQIWRLTKSGWQHQMDTQGQITERQTDNQ